MESFFRGKLVREAIACLIALMWTLMVATPSGAQLTRSYVSGVLTDQTGAVVAGVKVSITNQATGVERSSTTDHTGLYRFAAIEPGLYTLRFESSGFRTVEQRDVVVRSTGETVVNTSMEVAPAVTQVEVRSGRVELELERATASIGRNIGNREVKELPLSAARDINQLALLAPNTFSAPGSTGISANGQRARNNNFLIDGTENNDLSVTLQVIPLVPESVGEYQFQTNAYSAEFGRNSGAQINAITKSGTNVIHGEFWDYYRGSALNAMDPNEKASGLKSPARLNRNQFGADAGAPILKDRTFVFGLFQGDRLNSAASPGANVRIPTPAGFAALPTVPLRAASGSVPAQTIASRQAVLNALSFLNQIYSMNPVFRSVNATSLAVNGTPIQSGLTNIRLSSPFSSYQWLLRVDHKLTNKDSLTGRYVYHKPVNTNLISNCVFGPIFCGDQNVLGQNVQLSLTHVFTPSVVNEFRSSYTRRNLAFPENAPNQPTIGVGAFTIGGLNNFPQGRVQNNFQWADVLSWQRGRHGLKVGADIRRNRLFDLGAFDSKGTWTFDTFADFINNNASNFRQALNTATFDARQTQLFFFAQDDLKVTPDLTLNLGVRYENSGVPFGFFGATDPQSLAALVPGPVQRGWRDWAPRVGVAWNPRPSGGFLGRILGDKKTVFRAGYGISYDVLFYSILTVNASNFPRVVVSNNSKQIDVFPTQSPAAAVPAFNPLALYVNSPVNTRNPYAELYSLTIQRELAGNFLVEFGYTGSRGLHAIRQGESNPAILTPAQAQTVQQMQNANTIPNVQARRLFPQFGSRITIETTAHSSYNAFFVSVNKRLSHGLEFGVNYTVSKNMSDNDESLLVPAITNSSPQVPQDYFNASRGENSVSVFDRPQRFVTWYTYELPWFKSGAWSNPFVSRVLGGWQIEGITTVQGGQPFTIRTGVDSNGNGNAGNDRPDLDPSKLGLLKPDPSTGDFRSFTVPLQGGPFVTFLINCATRCIPLPNTKVGGGNLGRNTLRGPGFVNFNFGVLKRIKVREAHQIQFRADFLNFFNQRDWGNPVAVMSNPDFGRNLNNPTPRTITLSAKYSF